MIVSEKPIVTVDCDEPQADFVAAFLREVAYATGAPRRRDDITDFDITAALGLTPEQSDIAWARAGAQGFCRDLLPIPGAFEGIQEIRKFADVRALTSPMKSPTWAHEREHWLMAQMGYKRDEIIQTPGKDVVFAHVFVDDKLETLLKWRDRWPTSHAILWTAPWNQNRGWDGHQSNDWPTIVNLVRTLVSR